MGFLKKLFGSNGTSPKEPEKTNISEADKTDPLRNELKFDINQPVENPELVAAMNAFFKEKTESNLDQVIKGFLKAKFLALTLNNEMETENTAEGTVIKEGSLLKFLICFDPNDNAFFPLFTDWREAGNWLGESDENIAGFVMPTLEAFEFAQSDSNYKGIIINPGSEPWVMDRGQIANFLEDFKK